MHIRLSDESTADFGPQRARKSRRDRCIFANCIHPDNTHVDVQIAETEREVTRASPMAAAVGSMAARSGEGHDQGYRFAFSLTSRASVVLRNTRNSRGRVGSRPFADDGQVFS